MIFYVHILYNPGKVVVIVFVLFLTPNNDHNNVMCRIFIIRNTSILDKKNSKINDLFILLFGIRIIKSQLILHNQYILTMKTKREVVKKIIMRGNKAY